MSAADVHARSLETSTALSVYYIPDLIPPLQVIAALNAAMVEVNPEIDLGLLAGLGNLVHPNGGKELVERVGRVRRKEKFIL